MDICKTEYREKQKVSLLNTILNFMLAAAKFAAGIIYKSAAVVSDGVNSLSDALTNIIIIVGTKFSHAPADSDHNYGHEKIESVLSLVMALIMLAVGIVVIYGAAQALIKRQVDTVFSPVLVAVCAVSVAVKEIMYIRTIRCARKYRSEVLRADAWNYRADSLSSLAVLLGVGLGAINPSLSYLEPVAAIIVGILILRVAVSVGLSAVNQLVDRAADKDTVALISRTILSVPGVERIDSLKSRLSTYKIYVDVEIAVKADLVLTDAHDIAEAVHSLLENQYREFNIKHIHVHVNPLA